ncbi:MAG TPA: methyltransferase domain-containing protein, partial [Propionibacteriaceae bacterium]|nr:methyltransferase domain-containing protein [Propionibacteriaceae bacterium]
SPDKPTVFQEAFRVLRPGGRLAISDIVTLRPLPAEVADLMSLWTGCVSGAMPETAMREELVAAGFTDVDIELVNVYSRADLEAMAGEVDLSVLPEGTDPEAVLDALDGAVASAFVRATKQA